METELETIAAPRRAEQVRRYPRITRLGLAALQYWLETAKAGMAVDPAILTEGLDGSAVAEAKVEMDQADKTPMIAFKLATNQGADNFRFVDVEMFAYMRALLAGGGSFRLGRDKPQSDGPSARFYVEFQVGTMTSITLLRLVGDAQVGEEVSQIIRKDGAFGHHDCRARNLTKSIVTPTVSRPKPKQRTTYGRAEAERRATDYYAKRRSAAHLWLSPEDYATMLREIAGLIPVTAA